MELNTYELDHINRVRKLSPECMVLLKSDGSFPLKSTEEIALYGNGARRTIKGGTGSGDVNVRAFTTVEEGLEKAGFTITTKRWLDQYDGIYAQAHKEFAAAIKAKISAEGLSAIMLGIGAVMQEPEYELPLDGAGDTAIYVLSRVSGEGSDRQAITGDLKLSETEIHDILKLEKQYKRFLLVLNVGGVVDLFPIVKQISNILLLSQLGMAIGDAFADVLLGKSYPSGKLASTWAAWEDYCSIGEFGEKDDTRYKEGIYVGYRYFDTLGIEPVFPFGYGLSYTNFEYGMSEFSVKGTVVTVTTKVKNIGDFNGKEVIQLYVSVPSGKLDQPYQMLAAFGKTKELKPKEEELLTISYDMKQIASFDEDTLYTILESGDYVLRLGNSSRNTNIIGVIHLDETVSTQKLNSVGGKPDFVDFKPEKKACQEIRYDVPVKTISKDDFGMDKFITPVIDPEAVKIAKGMTDEELVYLCTGGFVDDGSNSFIGNAGMHVSGAAGETTGRYVNKGVPILVMADGPAGLRLSRQYGVDEQGVYSLDEDAMTSVFELLPEEMLAYLQWNKKDEPKRSGEIHEQYCTAIPVGTALAQSWNPEVCQECGDIVGEEMERFGVHLWLAPALNIHRLPLCGRNFEYYSEDPLISGKMAAGITMGTQKHPGCGVTVKHFVCNNQETNRMHSNSIVSQRALRDIYMKGFEIVVKEAAPHALMSSYNLLNGEHTSHRYDLMETVLREEWGYEGVVMSDWVTGGVTGLEGKNKYPGACASGAVSAGNDIMMPGGKAHYEDLLNSLKDTTKKYQLTRDQLEKCAARMIHMSRKLGLC